MKIQKTKLLAYAKASLIACIYTLSCFCVNAQNVSPASVTSNSINTPCGGPLSQNITSLNVDMVEINANTSTINCAWGTGSDTYIWGAGYSGLNQASPCTPATAAGITVGHSTLGQATVPLPSYWAIVPGPIDYIDAAIGVFPDQTSNPAQLKYIIVTVYESGGNIYLEHYAISTNPTLALVPPPTVSCPPVCGPTYAPVTLSVTRNASRPHIDLIYNKTYPGNSVNHEAIGYVVTWQEGSGLTAEVWGADGPLTMVPSAPIGNQFKIANGQMPDVAGVNAAQLPAGTAQDKAYIAYLNQAGDEVHLSEWDFNSGPTYNITNHGQIGTASSGIYSYPRISGPQYYDFGTPLSNDPACVIAASENPGGGANDKIHTFAYYTTGSPTIVEVQDASDYSSFGFSSYNAMKPSITGVGGIVSSLYAGAANAYTDYPTAFYADYNNNNVTWTTSGDIYAMGTDVTQASSPVVNLQGSNYLEVNGSELEISSYHSLPGNEPHVAIATTNNSGYNMLSAWFGGDLLYFALNNAGQRYQFKPGKPASVMQLAQKNYTVSPNPATTELTVEYAAGTSYTITDVTGRITAEGKIVEHNAAINVAGHAPGVYMLNLTKDNVTKTLKFVKQ